MSFSKLMPKWQIRLLRFENGLLAQALRSGFIMLIPVVVTGSVALAILQFPLSAVQFFLMNFAEGFLYNILNLIYSASYGFISVYLLFSVSYTWARLLYDKPQEMVSCIFTSLCCYVIFSGITSSNFNIEVLGINGIVLAIFCGTVGVSLFLALNKKLGTIVQPISSGVIGNLNTVLRSFIPGLITVLIFLLISYGICSIFGWESIFSGIENLWFSFFHQKTLTWVFSVFCLLIMGLLWFCGFPGLAISSIMYTPLADIVNNNILPDAIFSSAVFSTFVLPGGCGALLCLLLAIFIFGKPKMNKKYARLSLLPLLFNVNEILLFGLPVIFNPVLLIPFVLTPVALFAIFAFFVHIGFIILPLTEVVWTTPVLLSGWLSTGSYHGLVVQVIQLLVGIGIYYPFVKLLDIQTEIRTRSNLEQLISTLKKHEENSVPVVLTKLPGDTGSLAQFLLEELRQDIQNKKLKIFYQKQCDNKGVCFGVESLLRWNNKEFGYMYPPLIIKLAEEGNFIQELEQSIFATVVQEKSLIHERLGDDIKVSVNVSGGTIQTPEFESFLEGLVKTNSILGNSLWIEVTEQTELFLYDDVLQRLGRIREMGFHLVLDDFSMGCTSLHYLKTNHFDMVKLDGNLVSGITENPRCKDIIASIIFLAYSLGFSVLAEYVQTQEQQEELESIGCTMYQGYLYGCPETIENI